MTLKVQTDRSRVRAERHSVRYVLLSFVAPESPRASTREPVNVAFVIDRSGSMGGSKIRLAREAVIQALKMLRPADRFSLISYDDRIDVLVPSTLAAAEAVRNATSQVEHLEARGSTDLGAGWLKGCEEVAQHLQRGQVSRCLLLSDGLANHGITDRGELARHAAALRERGITTSTIGLGVDFDELTLESMATAGSGHFYFVEAPIQIADCLAGELGEALEVVAHDATVTVHAGADTVVTTLNRFPMRQDADGRVSVRLGDLASRQDVALVLRLKFPPGKIGTSVRAVFGVTDARGAISEPETDFIWTYADHAANEMQSRNVIVDRAVARLYAAQASAEALELNRARRFEEATARLEVTARRIERYAGVDPELRAILESLRERYDLYAQPMVAATSKAQYYASMNMSRMRESDGKARRRPT